MTFCQRKKDFRMLTTTLVVVIIMTCFGMTIATPPTDADCVDEVPFADTEDCTSYYQCIPVNPPALTLVHLQCPQPGGNWDDVYKSCVEGPCEAPTTTTQQPTTTTEPTAEASETTTASPEPSTSTLSPTSTPPPEDTSTTLASSSSTTSESPSTPSTESTSPSATSTDSQTTTPAPTAPPTFMCTSTGFFPHPTDPTKYYQCVLIGAQFYYYIYSCPPNSCFQESARVCVVGSCSASNSTTAPPVPTTTAVTTTPPPFVCSTTGFFAHPTDPTKYYQCVLIGGRYYSYLYTCPQNACFQQSSNVCVIGTCPTNTIPTTTTTTTPPPPPVVTTTTTPRPFVCNSGGYFAHPTDPTKYYQCVLIGGRYYSYLYTCPPSACFQQSAGTCVVGTCPPTKISKVSKIALPAEGTTMATRAPVDILCESEKEQHPFPGSCTKYYNCILLNDGFVYYVFECPPGSYFNGTTSLCATGDCPSSEEKRETTDSMLTS